MYSETHGTLTADDGTQFEVVVKHVDIDPQVAATVFANGREFGDEMGWKHKIWTGRTEAELTLVQAAARFYYGWNGRNERVYRNTLAGTWAFQAWYCS